MTTRPSTSRWRQRADHVIRRVLATLPLDMPTNEKRRRVEEHYPFGPRELLPYRHWCKAVNTALPKSPPVPPGAVTFRFKPLPGLPEQHLAFCRAMAAAPSDDAPRLIFADFLEERGEGRANEVRSPKVDESAVAARMFGKGTHVVHVGRVEPKRRIRNSHGGDICSAQLITDHLTGNPLLVLPELAEAIRVERTAAALRLFGEVKG